MVSLITPITMKKIECQITPTSHLIFCGSCFAETIGNFWQNHYLPAMVNPCGIFFNPQSITNFIELILTQDFSNIDIRYYRGRWISLDFQGEMSAETQEKLIEKIKSKVQQVYEEILRANYLVLTWGTAFAWFYKSREEKIVANCHRLPNQEFSRKLITHEEIFFNYQEIIKKLLIINPTLKIILTVSPIRHLRQLSNENSISKAHLLIAINDLVENFSDIVFYFPAYEIMMDELRDYRFYAEDLIHPSILAKEIICQRFIDIFASKQLSHYLSLSSKLLKQEQHHPNYLNVEMQDKYLKDLKQERLKLLYQFDLK